MSEEEEARKMSQYELELKLDRMTQRAFPNTIQKAPRKPLSEVDVQVIKEYQKQFNEPIQQLQYDIDEETGEQVIRLLPDGTPDYKLKGKKFRVVPPPELDVVDANMFYTIPTDEEKAQAFEQLNKMKELLEKGNRELQVLLEDKKYGFKLIDELPQPRRYVDRLDYDERKKFILGRIQEVDDEIADVNRGLSELTDLYNNIISEYQKIESYKSMNDAEVAKVKKINSERVKNYQETLNLMNRGAFQQDQMPNESEEDYIGRLQANAEKEYIDETKFEAELDNNRRFKQALKNIIRDDVIIEQVTNIIGSNVKGLNTKTEILKRLPLFRKKFIELYGINNKSIDKNDIINFINAFVSSLKGDNSLINYLGATSDFKEKKTLTQEEENKDKVLIIENLNQGKNYNKKLYLRIAEFINDNGETVLAPLFSFTGKRESYTVLDEEAKETIRKTTGITKAFIQSELEIKGKTPLVVGLQQFIESTREDEDEFNIVKIPTDTYDEDGEIYTLGWGIKQEEVPEIVPFGKIKIALNKLFYKNILSARHNNLGRIAGFQNVKVSDDFVAIIMKMIRNEKVIKQEIDALQKTEQMLYDRLLSLANLHKRVPNNKDTTITALKERMDLIGGEIDAGNDNKALVKELYNIVHALKNFGVITNKEATKYLSQF